METLVFDTAATGYGCCVRTIVVWVAKNRQSPSAASTTSWRQYDCVAPVPLRGLRTKNRSYALSKDGSMILDGGRWTALMCENHSGMETNTGKNMVHVKTALRENHSGMGGEDPPVAFGGQYHFVAPVRLRRASSASRAKDRWKVERGEL